MKKNIKKILFVLLIVLSTPIFFACGEKPTLSAPKNVEVSESNFLISWEEVENAEYYFVNINGKSYQTNSHSFLAGDVIGKSGNYQIKVSACDMEDNYNASPFSEEVSFGNLQKLGAPTLEINDYLLSWTEIEGAEYYTISVNGVRFVINSNQFDIRDKSNSFYSALLFDSENEFQVCATKTSNYEQGDNSNIVKKQISKFQDPVSNINIVKMEDDIVLYFDASNIALSYTMQIGDTKYQLSSAFCDISDKVLPGENTISVWCNSVLDGETEVYAESIKVTTFCTVE